MAIVKLEDMLKVIRDEENYRNDTYNRVNGSMASGKSWYTNDVVGKGRFFEDLKEKPTKPAPAVGGVVPGYSDATYAALPAEQKHTLLADLELTQYRKEESLEQERLQKEQILNQERKSSNSLITTGIVSLAASALLWLGYLKTPTLSVDEEVVKYQIEKHESDVDAYERSRGRSPPWEMTEKQIRQKFTKDNSTKLDIMWYSGLVTLLGGLASLGIGYKKRP